jgi:hypothetical protein
MSERAFKDLEKGKDNSVKSYITKCANKKEKAPSACQDFVTKASLSEGFMALFSTHSYFGNSAEEFHPHKTISTPMKLLSSLS